MVRVPVIKAFTHEGRAFDSGDTIEVTPVEAAVLHRRGYISLTKNYRTKDETADAPVADAPKRRRYRRKDLVAE